MTDIREQFKSAAQDLLADTVALRRDIHREPELGNDLPLTKQKVLDALKGIDLDYVHSAETSGIVATMNGDKNGPTILLRGDMDALPMPEDTGLEFASEIDGRMHACGHDSHTAMLVGAVKLLDRFRDQLPGAVKFMFQPGEEGYRGAKIMLDEGIIAEGREPNAVFALHVIPNRRSGMIMTRPGPILAAADTFFIKLIGRGGHGSRPHEANDPVPVACEIVQAIQTFVTRKINVFDPIVVTVGRIASGTTNNVIPETAEIDATCRSFSQASRRRAHEGITRLAEQIAGAHDMRAEVRLKEGYPSTVNHDGFAEFVKNSAIRLLGEDGYEEMDAPVMGAEDFSYLLQQYQGAFAFLGAAPEGVEPTTAPACHSNRMMIDEKAMAVGVATHAAVAYDFLTTNG